jgi:hypothetical protein
VQPGESLHTGSGVVVAATFLYAHGRDLIQ